MAAHEVSTVDPKDTRMFSQLGDAWWDPAAEMGPLHHLNPVRLEFIGKRICEHFHRPTTLVKTIADEYFQQLKALRQQHVDLRYVSATSSGTKPFPFEYRPLQGLRILDVGCGGGILSEPLAFLGADVTGIDSVGEALPVAEKHASAMGVSVTYKKVTVEALAAHTPNFDVVLAMEVIEHVANPEIFMQACASAMSASGLMILSTPNRTLLSYLVVILGAEYITRQIPCGMHTWSQFIKPHELIVMAKAAGLETTSKMGFVLDLFYRWHIINFDSIDYIVTMVKTK